ncbi:MAG: Plug domain-containing protein [Verrucomicrobiota bacterium]
MDDFVVEGRATTIVGEAVSASEGYIGRVDLDNRPLLRPGEILETVPGLIATQHSGSGKANQYFLRGFNLDHGTDFATFVDGMPVNMVSHGHGQGYTDLNFLIPETVELLAYQKGSYDAQSGDFTGAGSARIQTSDIRESGLASLSLGEHNSQRALVIDTLEIGHSNLLFALERELNDGPWELDENLDKINGLLKFSHQHQNDRLAIGFMGYDSTWNSTDQIPVRAITQNRIRPSGFLDPTVGGESSRYSLNASWERNNTQASTRLSAYSIYYDMDLWSNFTYFLEDPIDGDQFEQVDRRFIYGFSATHSLENREFFQRSARHYFGLGRMSSAISRMKGCSSP